jgi:K(+)-stimulated pyrophosphate-energized sodium pump
LLAVELAVSLAEQQGETLTRSLAVAFLLVALFFVHRSFYSMRIHSDDKK